MSMQVYEVCAIARTTFRELIRAKVLYSIIFFAVVLLLAAAFFGSITIGDRILVIKDFGLMVCSLFSVLFTLIAAATLLSKELSQKTIYNLLSRPIGRIHFIAGKYLGVVSTAVLMVVMLIAGLFIFLLLFDPVPAWLLFQAAFYIVLELIIVCGATMFFSAIVVTPSLAALFTAALFVAGRSVEYVRIFAESEQHSQGAAAFLKALYWILPHLERLNISNGTVYGDVLPLSHMFWSGLYALSYSAALLLIASFFFRRRDFN